MDKADYSLWLEHYRGRLIDLLFDLTEEAARAEGRKEVDLRSRLEKFTGRFLEYVRTGNIRIMIQQIEETSRRRLAAGEPLNFQIIEQHASLIYRAVALLLKESELSEADRTRFLQQLEHKLTNFKINGGLVLSRMALEEMNKSIKG